MDKLRCKKLFKAAGLQTPDWATITSSTEFVDIDGLVNQLGLPLVVKPALEGSSIGMSIVKKSDELEAAIELALKSDDVVLVEQFIKGKELTGAVLHKEALPLIHIEAQGFYDYDAKYFSEKTLYHCPSDLDDELEDNLREQCLIAFEAIGAYGWGRTDLMLDENDQAWILEVNTVPGMTSHSLVPMAATQAGYDFSDLVWKVLETSFTTDELRT